MADGSRGTSIIAFDGETTQLRRRRPWWFVPALAGIALGAVVGLALLPPRITSLLSSAPSSRTPAATQVLATGSPAPTMPAPTPVAAPPTDSFPPVLRPARVFAVDDASLSSQSYTRWSRYVLYEDGRFELQLLAPSPSAYRGTYTEGSGVIVFAWDNWTAGRATGSLEGDVLTVKYNLFLQMTDFDDAVYVRRGVRPRDVVLRPADLPSGFGLREEREDSWDVIGPGDGYDAGWLVFYDRSTWSGATRIAIDATRWKTIDAAKNAVAEGTKYQTDRWASEEPLHETIGDESYAFEYAAKSGDRTAWGVYFRIGNWSVWLFVSPGTTGSVDLPTAVEFAKQQAARLRCQLRAPN